MSKARLKFVKTIAVLITLYVGFYGYHYYFGIAPGGLNYQRQGYNTVAKKLLEQYQADQNTIFKESGKFDPELHKREPFSTAKSCHLYFANDRTEIAENCGDCNFTFSAYKIAAYGELSKDQGIWVIDESGKPENLKVERK